MDVARWWFLWFCFFLGEYFVEEIRQLGLAGSHFVRFAGKYVPGHREVAPLIVDFNAKFGVSAASVSGTLRAHDDVDAVSARCYFRVGIKSTDGSFGQRGEFPDPIDTMVEINTAVRIGA